MSIRAETAILEEGVFGLETITFGPDTKERFVFLRSIQKFRYMVCAGVLFCFVAATCALSCWRASVNITAELVKADSNHANAVCRAMLESIMMKQEEIDELANRFLQRQSFDRFLEVEEDAEDEMMDRVKKLLQSGPENEDRKKQLQEDMERNMKWFMEEVDKKVAKKFGPLQAVHKTVPRQLNSLQNDIARHLSNFKQDAEEDEETEEDRREDGAGRCQGITKVVRGSVWEQAFHDRIVLLAKGFLQSPESRERADLANIARSFSDAHAELPNGNRQLDIAEELAHELLEWFTSLDAKDTASLLHMDQEIQWPEEPDDDEESEP